jgi:hypothetical protein
MPRELTKLRHHFPVHSLSFQAGAKLLDYRAKLLDLKTSTKKRPAMLTAHLDAVRHTSDKTIPLQCNTFAR